MTEKKYLTKEEELELGNIIKNSTNEREIEDAKTKLFMNNKDYAESMARKMLFRSNAKHYSLEDAIGDAYEGLANAISAYDPEKDAKLITSAHYTIRKRLQVGINNGRPLSVKSRESGIWGRYIESRKQMEMDGSIEGMNEADIIEIVSKEIGCTPADVIEILAIVNGTVSLDTPVNGEQGDSSTFGDIYVDSLEDDSREILEDIYSYITEDEREVLIWYYDDKKDRIEDTERLCKKHDTTQRGLRTMADKIRKKIKAELNIDKQ